MRLECIIVVNHQCNLRCRYCPTIRDLTVIDYQRAKKAINFLFTHCNGEWGIKFFGGEPFLQFDLVTKIITYARKISAELKRKIVFQITTNGTLFDYTKWKFLVDSPDIELLVSLDGDRNTQLKNRIACDNSVNAFDSIFASKINIFSLPLVTVNMVIAPNQVDKFYSNFLYILSLGVRRFNFLPAYFVFWPPQQQKILKEQFFLIKKYLLHQQKKIYIKNIDVTSPTPLFNQGFVIDCNGDVFKNNLFLARKFSGLRERFKIGSIQERGFYITSFNRTDLPFSVISNHISKKVLLSTQAVDRILTEFVEGLKNEKA